MFKFLVATISQSRTQGLCSIVMCFLFLEILIPMFPKVATKCIRVSSTATNKAVIETLIEKFRPDMKMLEVNIQFMLFIYFLFFFTSLKLYLSDISHSCLSRYLSMPYTKSTSQGKEDLVWTRNLCLFNLTGTG